MTAGTIRTRDVAALSEAVTAALHDDQDAVIDAVARISPEAGRIFWAALSAVQGCIEDMDTDLDADRPWEATA